MLALLVARPVAAAAAPGSLGPGKDPAVAVDGAGDGGDTFQIATKRARIDRKAPFAHTFRVLATQPPGSTITLRARAFIKMKRGKSPTKSISATVKVCG